ncbi:MULTISPECIES: NAD(P)/FAD-dependent oxidoreductase [Nocardioides]|uniref:NAD(P)/FAD-dependent oxidoreductase n=1 Tax=Nocardioides vastitatis TaxID=2568655 RepID=A0ABW0ZQ03_9ACTN|nr:FAD/NAD(P)-binding oxidoreductase [Nocardioides sp.]THI96780.1 NAD(P)/FAD-dependent oxidoreductase [Nocardioides sp.]
MGEQRVVVAGGGVAGLRVAQQLRAAGWTGYLGVIGAERHLPYNRPPLTKEALWHGVDVEVLKFPMPDAEIDWRLGTRIVSSDLAAKRLTLEGPDGTSEQISFDGLVIATGVGPRRLPLDGPHSWRYTVRTPEDAASLRGRLVDRPRVGVIGGGFVGCEVAAAAATLGCKVTVVEPLSTPLERVAGHAVGAEVQRRHEAHGVRFVLGRTIAAIEGDARGSTGVVLDDGTTLAAEVVVEAVGGVPNTDWLAGQGLNLSDGVLCDRDLHPLAEGGPRRDVVALGDVARFPLDLYGADPLRIEHWQMAGDCAGHAARSLITGLAGAERTDAPFELLPSFWTDQYDTRVQFLGLPSHGIDDVRVLEGDLEDEAVIGYHRQDTLIGLALLGMRRRLLPYRQQLVEGLREACGRGIS